MDIGNSRLAQAGLAVLLSSLGASANAQAPWPAKSIRMLIALAPGGGVDTTGRILAQKLSERWGQPIVVENRPGAGGALATETLARATPDGYTMLTNSSGVAITPSLMKLSYDPRKDIIPVSLAVISPGVMVVHPSVPVKTVKEFIAFARARPGDLLYSSSGNGTGQHLAAELFGQMAGVKMAHVPYKGTAPSITDLIGATPSPVARLTVGLIALTTLFASWMASPVLYSPGQPDAERVLTPRYRLELIDRGMAIGDAAKPLFALDWPSLLHRDLEELRQELGVEPLREGPGSWYSRPELMAALG